MRPAIDRRHNRAWPGHVGAVGLGMRTLREEHRVGLHYLEDVTVLLQRIRSAHPTAGLYEAADLQWWWRKPRSTDDLPQLFWFDHLGRPEAAVIATDWGDCVIRYTLMYPANRSGKP